MHLKKLFSVSLPLFATIVLMAGTADAQVERAVIRSQAAHDGFVANDILLDFAGIYTGSQLILNLDSGSIFNHAPPAGNVPPSESLFAVPGFENLPWDTFTANGGPTTETTVGNFGLGGSAINADANNPSRGAKFASDGIDQAWNPAGGNEILDQDGFMVARITLSNDATGTASFIASANQQLGVPVVEFEGLAAGSANGEDVPGMPAGATWQQVTIPILNGVMGGGEVVIPEPSTFVLLGISLIGLIALKRRSR